MSRVGTITGPNPKQSSTPACYRTTLALKLFRGEPAISEFDWHFTANHRSSKRFATRPGAALHPDIIGASACPWLGHSVSGLLTHTNFALFRLAFTMPPENSLSLRGPVTRWIVLQKARHHPPKADSDSLYAHNFRLYFTPLPGVLLTFPSRYSFTIDHKTYLALEGGPSCFNQGFTCPDLLDLTV